MDNCPACNAKYKNKRICHRCKTDLGPLLAMEEEALEQKQSAVSAYRTNEFGKMFYHARRSVCLFYTNDGAKLLASAAVLEGRFDLALNLWKKIGQPVAGQVSSPGV